MPPQKSRTDESLLTTATNVRILLGVLRYGVARQRRRDRERTVAQRAVVPVGAAGCMGDDDVRSKRTGAREALATARARELLRLLVHALDVPHEVAAESKVTLAHGATRVLGARVLGEKAAARESERTNATFVVVDALLMLLLLVHVVVVVDSGFLKRRRW